MVRSARPCSVPPSGAQTMKIFRTCRVLQCLSTKALLGRCWTVDSFSTASLRMTTSKMSSVDEFDDEFGDSSFFENFDPDAFVEATNKKRRVTLVPEEKYQATLQEYFGYSHFRKGQLEVLKAVVEEKRDVAVFWATGSGKSLCYQIPALAMDSTVLVISPLISLMQDQVAKLNSLGRNEIATFLGSGQTDPSAQSKALRGEYKLVYVTPEKFVTLQDQLASMRIALVAVDESHCVSEWGFDFRPEFRQVGTVLRLHPLLSQIPLMALTATATPRVRQDISTSLRLRSNALVSLQSLDRTNLQLSVRRKMGIPNAMKDLVEAPNMGSTIVYAPTRNLVEDITAYLLSQKVPAAAYHAGLSTATRHDAHTNFLTGATPVIVATTAFGMGIDKPDIRRLIHYGPSKTVEEFYQQIGRAGRDGLPATCVLYVTDADFNSYLTDYYLGGLTGAAKQAVTDSCEALRKYTQQSDTCRRQTLLQYFGETLPTPCGICDVCRVATTYSGDTERDFGDVARIILTAVAGLKDFQSETHIQKVIAGSITDSYRYRVSAEVLQRKVEEKKAALKKKYPKQVFQDVFRSLIQKSYLSTRRESQAVNGYERSWSSYTMTSTGSMALANTAESIILPVPESIREMERKEEERRQKVLARLEKNGIRADSVPPEELKVGDGPVIQAFNKWYSYLENAREAGRPVDHLETLASNLEKWRAEAAIRLSVAPSSVLAEHLLYSLAYTTATLPPGVLMTNDSLYTAGVRTREVDSLVTTLTAWQKVHQPKKETPIGASDSSLMILKDIRPAGPWQFAVYKPLKKSGMPAWEASYVRVMKGESLQSIAMSQDGKKPIQAKTVAGHLFDAVVQGRTVNLAPVTPFVPAPSKAEWQRLKEAELTTEMNVEGDPKISGVGGEVFRMGDFLRPIVGDAVVDTPGKERSNEQTELFSYWCDRLKWYMALRRVGYEPEFSS